MYIHHKNQQYLCNATEVWVRRYLSDLGIDEFGCNFLDLQDNTYLPLGSGYTQYCEFIEKQLHHHMAARIKPGIRHWDPDEVLFKVKASHYPPKPDRGGAQPTLHALDWTIKTATGFELFFVVSHQPLQAPQIKGLQHWLRVFSYKGAQVKKYKPKALLEIENRDAVAEKFSNFGQTQTKLQRQKAKFDTLILTAREQEYIQHLLLHRPYRDMAAYHQVSEITVHKGISNIKRKLGCARMSTPEMMHKLNACGALGACMQGIKRY